MMLVLNKRNIYLTFRLDLVHVYFIRFRIQNPKRMDTCGINYGYNLFWNLKVHMGSDLYLWNLNPRQPLMLHPSSSET